jgi:hypothetical protein
MFARIEVAIRPEYSDPTAQSLLKRIHGQLPELRKKIRWARLIDVYWIDVPRSREDIIPACQEIFQDRVTQWLFTGNLIPSASGKAGSLEDLMEASPVRPGKFWGVERRLRTGLTDSRALAALEALRVVLGSDLQGATTATGQLLLLEGAHLAEADLSQLAREVWCNESSETWTILPEHEIVGNDRFHQEKKQREDVPRFEGSSAIAKPSLQGFARRLNSPRLTPVAGSQAIPAERSPATERGSIERWIEYSRVRGWDWTREHWESVLAHWGSSERTAEPSELELALLATCWSAQARGRVWSAEFSAEDSSRSYVNLFSETIGATVQQQPRPWILSTNESRPALLALSEEISVSWSSRISADGSSRDPYADALNTILGVQRDLLGADAFSLPLLQSQVFEGDALHKGVLRRAAELASNRTQVPMLAGADLGEGDATTLSPMVASSGVGTVVGRERSSVRVGDRIGWLATGTTGPAALEDPVSQRKWMDALGEAQAKGLIAAVRSSGALPAVWAVVQLARETGGAALNLPVGQLGELLSRRESLVLAVRPDRWAELKAQLEAWGVQLSACGGFDSSGRFQVLRGTEKAVDIDLGFLWDGAPLQKIAYSASLATPAARQPDHPPFKKAGDQVLRELLGSPEVRSPERILQAFDLEAQAHTVLKPLHSVALSSGDWLHGPNDGTVAMVHVPAGALGQQPSMVGLSVGGVSRRSLPSHSWRAWRAVDEALRNLVCTGAQVGADESACALSIQWRGESPERHPSAAGELVETLEALRDSSLALGVPIVQAGASFSGRPIPGTLVCHALGNLKGVRWARSADFKSPSDAVYLLGPECLDLAGSLFAERFGCVASDSPQRPDWALARRLYGWLGGVQGKEQGRIRSLHDVSDGGLLVALSEGLMARGLGLTLRMPDEGIPEAWAFSEGFHRMVLSCSEADSAILEAEWEALRLPHRRLGSVTNSGRLEIVGQWSVAVSELRKAWRAEEAWT